MQMLVTDREPDMFERDCVVSFNYGDLFLYGSVVREQHFEDGVYLTIWLKGLGLVKYLKLQKYLEEHGDKHGVRLTDARDTVVVNVSKVSVNKVNITDRSLIRIRDWCSGDYFFVDYIKQCLESSSNKDIENKCLDYLYMVIKETDDNGEVLDSSNFRKEDEIKWLMTTPIRYIGHYLFIKVVVDKLIELIINELVIK